MFQGSSSPASFSIFSILSAIRFFSMINLIREVLRGEREVGTSRIKNMRFPDMHIYSIILISMVSSDMPLGSDSGKSQNPEYSTIPVPSQEMNGKGIMRLGSLDHPLKKLGSCCKVGLGIVLTSLAEEVEPFRNILFGPQVKGDFPKLLGSSVELENIISSENKVDASNPSSFDEPFDSSSVNLTNNIDIMSSNVSGENVPIRGGRNTYVRQEWPCVFAMNQSFNSVTRGSQSTNTNGSLESQKLTICIKHRTAGFLTLEEIENTENYTRRTDYLPHPKVTHMYNYCILDFPPTQSSHGNFDDKKPGSPPILHNLRRCSLFSSNENFLKNCETCDKSLEGIDVYIYRGESSFCSLKCRYWKVKAEREFTKMTRMIPMYPIAPSNKKPVFYVGVKPPAGA